MRLGGPGKRPGHHRGDFQKKEGNFKRSGTPTEKSEVGKVVTQGLLCTQKRVEKDY